MSDETANAHESAPGHRIPCKVFEAWLPVFKKAGIEPAGFFKSVDLERSHVTNFDNRICWDKWLDAVEALERVRNDLDHIDASGKVARRGHV